MQEGNLVHRFRNNYATHLSANLIAQMLKVLSVAGYACVF